MGAINMHSIDVSCEVEADPAEGVRFSWTYNNTRNVSPVCLYNIIVLIYLLYILPLLLLCIYYDEGDVNDAYMCISYTK